ncbi:MAG: phosphate-starvation-inducible PsiE family protein [Parasulfuritortus sp.]|jgi:protein PsiE|nr:phosphate-starvation-inducible PsiE family protein [Parasulfuritortus sp.]
MKQNLASKIALSILGVIEHVGLAIITVATVIAGSNDVATMFAARTVALTDLLLLFLYLEVLAMVGLYYRSGKLPVRFPIYIAIVALARYLVLEMKSLNELQLIGIAGAILMLALSVLVIRLGHVRYPYGDGE